MENITLVISVKTGVANEIINDLSSRWGYSNISGLTKAQFVRKRIAQYIKAELIEYRVGEASSTASAQEISEVEALQIT